MTVCDKWPPEHIGMDGADIWHKAPGFHKHVPRKQVAFNFHQLTTPKTSKSSYLKLWYVICFPAMNFMEIHFYIDGAQFLYLYKGLLLPQLKLPCISAKLPELSMPRREMAP